jgi:opacity protein-like surface antigen
MKKIALMVILAMVAASPAVAAKKGKRMKAPRAEVLRQVDPNEASWRLVVGSLPIWLPSWSMPMYMALNKEEPKVEKPVRRRMARKRH